MTGLAERMKSYERFDNVEPYESFVVRADGKNFSTFTRNFKKPYDEVFQNIMTMTANDILSFFNPHTVYVCSDEITLVFPKLCTKEEFDTTDEAKKSCHLYNGRISKIETIVASKISVVFNRLLSSFRPDLVDRDPVFDARLIKFPEDLEHEIVNNLIWRSEYDCYRNCVSTFARHVLGTKATHGKNRSDMIQMMQEKGFDWDDVQMSLKYGIICKKTQVSMVIDGNECIRHKPINFSIKLSAEDFEKTKTLVMSKYCVDLEDYKDITRV